MSDRDWRYWWSLPGPAAFVGSLAEDLRRGANLVVGLPRWAPEGLGQALAMELRDDDLISWRSLPLQGHAQNDPLGQVAGRYAPDVAKRGLRGPVDLVDSADFSGNLVWVTGLGEGTWALWKDLLERYADAVRRRPAEDRGLICLVVSGLAPGLLPKEDVALAVHLWLDVVTELDMLTWLHYLINIRGMRSAMRRRLHLRHALELVAYDPRLARDAVSRALEVLAAPAAWLGGVAATRGWTMDTTPCWEEGTCDRMEERTVLHPALLAVSDGAEAKLGSLVWRAQIGVLFPYLEEERNRYLSEYASHLRVPHNAGHGWVIQDRQELEIGHIHHQLRWHAGAKELSRLRMLREVRNTLAHHTPLGPELLQELVGIG